MRYKRTPPGHLLPRLRSWHCDGDGDGCSDLGREAATEIERLRHAIAFGAAASTPLDVSSPDHLRAEVALRALRQALASMSTSTPTGSMTALDVCRQMLDQISNIVDGHRRHTELEAAAEPFRIVLMPDEMEQLLHDGQVPLRS